MFQPVIWRLGLRYTSRRFFQSVLFILGVALGVAVVIAVDLANSSASRAFALSAQSVTGRATHQIVGGPTGIPTELYRQIRLDLDLRDSAPIVSDFVRALDLGDQPLRLLGVDPFAEPPFRDYLANIDLQSTRESESDDAFAALADFIAQPRTGLMSTTLAERFGLQAGDTITLQPGTERIEVRVVGLLQPNDQASRQALDDLLLTDIATAQELAGLPGRISRIDLILDGDDDPAAIRAILPEGVTLTSASSTRDALSQMTNAFEINLQALSLLAVVVGVFLIYNTVTFSVVQRRKVIGILRAVGATRRQIFAFILGEAFVLGLLGTIAGMGLGVILGRVMVGLVAQTISDFYFTVNVQSVTVAPLSLIKGAGLGLAASVGAALIPSWNATQTPPAGTMRRSSVESQTTRLIPYMIVGALLALGVGYLLLQVPTTNLIISFTALFAVILGGALLTPPILLGTMRAIVPLTGALFGVLGRMAPRAVTRSLSRTGIAVAALTIAVSVIVGVSVMIDSFRSTVDNWLQTTLGADIYIAPPALTAGVVMADVDPDVRDTLANLDGVELASASRGVSVRAPEYPDLPLVNLIAVDVEISEGNRRFAWNNAPNGDYQAALEAGGVMVSEPFAFRRGITPENNTITLQSDEGPVTFEIFGVYYDYSTDQGTLLMTRETYDQYWDDPFISSVALFLEEGVSLNAMVDQLRTETLVGYDLRIQGNRELREGVFEIFDRTFTITIALRLLATVVAFIGILSALLALQLEQTRQYGVMRATGMLGRQLWQYTLIQTGLMGTVAGLMALPIGLALAVVLIFVINVRSFGWTLQFTPTPDEFLTAFMVALIAALLAGVYPAWKLSRLQPAEALRSE